MPGRRYKVLVTDYLWPNLDVEKEVLAPVGADVVPAPDAHQATLVALAHDADAILTCFAPVTAPVVEAAHKCLVISRYGVGVDNIDVEAASRNGIIVAYVPDYCVDEVADHALALLLALNRRLPQFDAEVKQGLWGKTHTGLPIFRLRECTLGLIGFGRIGQALCRKALALGLRVLAYDPYLPTASVQGLGAHPVDLPTLLRESDFVSVHAPLTPETRGLLGEKEFQQMKPTAFLINCARGPIVDQDALLKALRERWIAGAGLDVLAQEPPPPESPLLSLDNVLITPHVAYLSRQSLHELLVRTAGAVAAVLTGRRPQHIFNPQVLATARARLGPLPEA